MFCENVKEVTHSYVHYTCLTTQASQSLSFNPGYVLGHFSQIASRKRYLKNTLASPPLPCTMLKSGFETDD